MNTEVAILKARRARKLQARQQTSRTGAISTLIFIAVAIGYMIGCELFM